MKKNNSFWAVVASSQNFLRNENSSIKFKKPLFFVCVSFIKYFDTVIHQQCVLQYCYNIVLQKNDLSTTFLKSAFSWGKITIIIIVRFLHFLHFCTFNIFFVLTFFWSDLTKKTRGKNAVSCQLQFHHFLKLFFE